MPYPETATGFVVKDPKKWQSFHKEEFKLKTFKEDDVDIAIDACGVCGSDVHSITGGWGETPLPLCVGHEIIGRAVKVGSKVKDIKVGDRVGVGAQVGADLTCDNCKADQENYCPNQIDTYGAKFDDGVVSQGGFSSHIRVQEYFVFKIPENLDTAIAAPMLCAGLTTYSPLVRLGCGPGKKVGIVGIGGLGHFALMWAHALGAEVFAISHTKDKEEDAKKLGADHFIYSGDKDWAKPYAFKFDFILNCSDMTQEFEMSTYLGTLKVMGRFHNVGLPDYDLPAMKAQDFAPNGSYIGASHIGNHPEMVAMLELASKQNIKSWIETIPISAEGCAKAVTGVKENKVRYRYTLTGFDEAFGKRY
ncbi:NADPH-dependent medium chain alcohol dehydrogenase [Aureobasidium pullulans]|nr:NADPH-dependent medium chain alcohol dehydrogenase [Aureobasidium pullulans]THW31651.1 NADPH-dependent medium chain alcohol dehydrogenase [Aureobasidium pullulans]THW94267.1 NADPH-dependent medium chain alcohol dehydrogenase [Aureobasidium pullulans]THX30930.1 NADPH-dependent medium chain alcohol dehydrogenase [Aureobasidium pullulans]THX31042.1 NADPH-dependent medium chain alcohol dehydrogenase [Aureobasidium pullulans]